MQPDITVEELKAYYGENIYTDGYLEWLRDHYLRFHPEKNNKEDLIAALEIYHHEIFQSS